MKKKLQDFLDEIIFVCQKHDICISHEDTHGSFKFEEYNKRTINWLKDSSEFETIKKIKW